jgi:hypothetical protein
MPRHLNFAFSILVMAGNEKKYKFSKGEEGDNKNTILLIGVLLVLILIIGGVLAAVIMSKMAPIKPVANPTQPPPVVPPKPPVNTSNASNGTLVPPICSDACHLQKAIQQNNVSECLLVSEASVQDCLLQLSNTSLTACTSLIDENRKKSCIMRFAVSGNDSSLCDVLISTAKEECRSAFPSLDPCKSSSDKPLCWAVSAKDPAKCGSSSRCLLDYSVTLNDSSVCGSIGDAVMSKACLSATLRKDKCSDLPALSQRDYCYELWALEQDDFYICTQITGDTMYSLDCYSTFAAKRGELSICDRDSFSLNSLWACYTNYSLITGDIAGCKKIDALATTSLFRCGFEYAKKYGDPSACQVITDSLNQRSTCYQGVIIYSNKNLDWTKCKAVVNHEWYNACYTESAQLNDNVSLCDYIANANERQGCIDSFNANKNK